MDARSLAARSVALASLLCEERRERAKREREGKNELGFLRNPASVDFIRPISPLGRRMQTDGADSLDRLSV